MLTISVAFQLLLQIIYPTFSTYRGLSLLTPPRKQSQDERMCAVVSSESTNSDRAETQSNPSSTSSPLYPLATSARVPKSSPRSSISRSSTYTRLTGPSDRPTRMPTFTACLGRSISSFTTR
jgi:hypothetical protein